MEFVPSGGPSSRPSLSFCLLLSENSTRWPGSLGLDLSPSSWLSSSSCKSAHYRRPYAEMVAHANCSIGVTTRSRPAAAPPTGPYEFGFYVIAHPTFVAGMSASCNIFVSSSGTSAFLPVIAEMKNPRDYNKAVYLCMALVNASYIAFSLVVYRWCGQWVASPSLGVRIPFACHISPWFHG